MIVSTEKEEDEGRGQRVKAAVIYDDGLTEEQFLNVSRRASFDPFFSFVP